VAPIVSFKDEADAIRLANGTPYGLASYFYSRDLPRIFRVAEALDFGMVGVNETLISRKPRFRRDQAFRSGARGLALWSR